MFIGHFGMGFAGKRAAPRVSLGTLFLAAQWVDLVWPTFLLLGLEKVAIRPGITAVTPLDFVSYPLTHSLLAVGVWSALFALTYGLLRRRPRASVVLGLLVVSHWVLDLLVHRPDLPLVPGGLEVGLGLWYSLPATLLVEVPIFLLGVAFYLRTTRARDRVGSWALWSLVAFLGLVYAGNLWGPPPPNVTVLAWTAQSQWLIILWGYWVDAHREAVVAPSQSAA